MRIAQIESFPVRIPLKPERRMISALGRHDVSDFVLVKITTECGAVGVGEATVTARWSGETMRGTKALIDYHLAPTAVGCDPANIEELDQRMRAVAIGNPFAKSAIEMACWDLVGREAGKPVYELLGGAVRDRTIRCRFSLGAYAPELAAERAAALVEQGFRTIKVKVGTNPDEDIRRVRSVREAIGEDNSLTIDANGGWSFEDAARCLKAMESCRVEIVEQPLQRGDYTGMKRLRVETGCRILADESCFELIEAIELIQHACCDALTVYPGKHGGIQKAVRIAELAEQHGLPCTIGSNLEWDVGAAAMMHFVLATANVTINKLPGDCLGPSYHARSIATNPIQIDGPFVTLSDRPGLGIDVDWDCVEEHRVSD